MKDLEEHDERLDPDAGPERVAIRDAAREAGDPTVQIGNITISGPAGWDAAVEGSSDVVRLALQGALRLHAAGYRDTDDTDDNPRAFRHEAEDGGGIGVGGVTDDDAEEIE